MSLETTPTIIIYAAEIALNLMTSAGVGKDEISDAECRR